MSASSTNRNLCLKKKLQSTTNHIIYICVCIQTDNYSHFIYISYTHDHIHTHMLTHSYTLNVVYSHDDTQKTLCRSSLFLTQFIYHTNFYSTYTYIILYSYTYVCVYIYIYPPTFLMAYLTPSLPWCHLKTTIKSEKFETLKLFCLLFRTGTWKDLYQNA